MQPGGYRRRCSEDYDRDLCLLPNDVVDFVLATQPKEWQKLSQHHGAQVKERFLRRLATEVERRGSLDVLRRGVKDMGSTFRLAWFRPASALTRRRVGCMRRISSRWRGRCGTAPAPKTAWTWCCSSTACRSSPSS